MSTPEDAASRNAFTDESPTHLQVSNNSSLRNELPPQTVMIPWDGNTSDLTPEQVSDLERAGVDLSVDLDKSTVEPIDEDLLQQAGACEIELGHDVVEGLEACGAARREAGRDTGTDDQRLRGVQADDSGETVVLDTTATGTAMSQPAESPCITYRQEEQIDITRTLSCFSYDVIIGVYQIGTNTRIGGFVLTVLNTTSVTSTFTSLVTNQSSVRKSNSDGVALNRSMQVNGTYSCSSSHCSTGSTTTYSGTSDGWWNTATGSSTVNFPRGMSSPVTENWTFDISLPGFGKLGTTYNALALKPRCDNYGKGLQGVGCVFPTYTPWFSFPSTGDTAQAGQHIQKAIASGLPSTLTRGFPEDSDQNRKNVCPRIASLPRDTGYECDEYPFASTVEGGNPMCVFSRDAGGHLRSGPAPAAA